MRAALGLPQPERRIGLSAHDFVTALAADDVLLTRSEREGSAPTVPSRWLARLDALFGYDAGDPATAPGIHPARPAACARWAEPSTGRTDTFKPGHAPAHATARGPADRLSVTRIEQWRRDPYGLYARCILGLRPLDPLEEELGAADRGSALHDALDEFLKTYPSGLLPSDALALFEAMGEKHLQTVLAAPAERAFWWPRFQRSSAGSSPPRTRRRAAGTRLLGSETVGEMKLGATHGQGECRPHRRDRTRRLGDHRLQDRPRAVGQGTESLFAPQLLLEAAIAERGSFGKIKGRRATVHLSYWHANGLGDGGAVKVIEESDELVPAMMALCRDMIDALRQSRHALRSALPWPEFGPHFNDYEHLERVAEWSTAGGGEE